jgi:hypothetical protein
MIQKIQFGKNTDCTDVVFGTGDIMFHGMFFHERPEFYCLAFSQTEPRNIGAETEEFKGMTSDELPYETKLVLSFNKPESVTALIHSLIELQKRMFDKEQQI